jgi:hypothetical protein
MRRSVVVIALLVGAAVVFAIGAVAGNPLKGAMVCSLLIMLSAVADKTLE